MLLFIDFQFAAVLLFGYLVYDSRQAAQHELENARKSVIDAQNQAANEIAKIESEVQTAIEYAKADIEDSKFSAREGIQSVGEIAQREINNIKEVAQIRVEREVENFINSTAIQDEIDKKVRQEIDQVIIENLEEVLEINNAYALIIQGELYGFEQLKSLSQSAKSDVVKDIGSRLLSNFCMSSMLEIDSTFGTSKYENTPDIQRINNYESQTNNALNELLRHIKMGSTTGGGYSAVRPIKTRFQLMAGQIHRINKIYGTVYSVCDYEEVIQFLENYNYDN